MFYSAARTSNALISVGRGNLHLTDLTFIDPPPRTIVDPYQGNASELARFPQPEGQFIGAISALYSRVMACSHRLCPIRAGKFDDTGGNGMPFCGFFVTRPQ